MNYPAAMSGLLPLPEHWRLDMTMSADALTSSRILDLLLTCHREPHRRYHGPAHLRALFALMSLHAPQIPPGSAPRLAIWWHDAIYNPQARDNEERSADLARSHLPELGFDPATIDETCSLILMTKDHWDGPGAGDGDYFLDADIAILGAPPLKYDEYAAQVRQEYSWAPDDLYRTGRSAFLAKALARERLFRTDAFQSAYAGQAKENMSRELASLP
jgi:predicted metal-dependent HD superfamily phosphohydrolase